MPPWHADPAYGEWANDVSLSEAEIETITQWIDQGAPAGDLSIAPMAPEPKSEWLLGPPDLETGAALDQDRPGRRRSPARSRRPDRDSTGGNGSRESSFLPGDRRVVHHITGYIGLCRHERSGRSRGGVFLPRSRSSSSGPGGQPPMAYPEGVGTSPQPQTDVHLQHALPSTR